jgi:Ser/Thr protein kinase RdoA (MazF antagonist)
MSDSASARQRVLRRWEPDDPNGVELRELTDRLTRRELLLQHEVAASLAAAGLPVPAPIPTLDGRSFVTAGGQRYALFPRVEGRPRNGLMLSYAQCQDLGALLGRLHAELQRLLPPVQQTFLVPAARAEDALDAVDALLAALPEPRDDLGSLAERHLAERAGLLADLADHRPPEAEAVTAGYVHGAFHPANVLYGKVGVVAVVGWDGISTAPVAGELVSAATRFFDHGDDRGLDLDRVTAFVRGHATAFALDADQIQSAAHRAWWELLCDVSDRRPLVQWWTEHLESTLDAFAAAYVEAPQADRHDEILEVS